MNRKHREKYQADAVTRGKIKKVARLRDHPATPAGERHGAFYAVARLVTRLNFSKKSFDKHFGAGSEMIIVPAEIDQVHGYALPEPHVHDHKRVPKSERTDRLKFTNTIYRCECGDVVTF